MNSSIQDCANSAAKYPVLPNRYGMDKALDLVEEALAKLKEREERANRHLGARTNGGGVDAQTSTTNLCPGYDASTSIERETSVLISRKSSKLSSSSKVWRYKNASAKAKAKKNQSPLPGRSQPKQKSCSHETIDVSRSKSKRIHRCNAGHLKNVDKRRSKSSEYLQRESGRSVQNMSNCIRSPCGEILRHADSGGAAVDLGKSSSWIPPLSQSSPRELTRSRNNSRSKHSHLTIDTLQNANVLATSNKTRERNSKSSYSSKSTFPVSGQSYAEPTLTSKMRVKLSERKEKAEKENVTPFIPSGSTNTSHHVGVIIQQKLGLLKNIPPKEFKSLKESLNEAEVRSDETDCESFIPTEEDVRIAISNIQEHIAHIARQSSKQ